MAGGRKPGWANRMDATEKLPTVNLEELEKLAIIQALAQFDGNRTKAARVMGISIRCLQRKMKIYRLRDVTASNLPNRQECS